MSESIRDPIGQRKHTIQLVAFTEPGNGLPWERLELSGRVFSLAIFAKGQLNVLSAPTRTRHSASSVGCLNATFVAVLASNKFTGIRATILTGLTCEFVKSGGL